MLTRCKQGMVIVSQKAFLRMDEVRDTLLGEICSHWETKFGKKKSWIGWNQVLNKTAVLPVKVKPQQKQQHLTAGHGGAGAGIDSSKPLRLVGLSSISVGFSSIS